jgi:electron transfer flavoprotein beta subunit
MPAPIYVCIKHVPSSENLSAVDPLDGSVEAESWLANVLDLYALQAALTISVQTRSEIVVISAGGKHAEHSLRLALALGADRGILISPVPSIQAPEITAGLLADCINEDATERGVRQELILCGRQSSDTAGMQVHYRLAAQMGFNMVNDVLALAVGAEIVRAVRSFGTSSETVEVDLPCVIGICRGPGEIPRPSLPGLYKARTREIKTRKPPAFRNTHPGSKLVGVENKPEYRSCRMAEGLTAEEKTRHLISMLRAEGHLQKFRRED